MTETLGRLDELISMAEDRGKGIFVQPVFLGQRIGGLGSEFRAEFDGWLVGWSTPNGGDEMAVGATVSEAVERAIEVWEEAG